METWPNFFIAGAPRCGTTSLWFYLSQSPEIFLSSNKEPRYFNSAKFVSAYSDAHIHDEKKYLALFHGVQSEKAIGEASTSYLSDPTTPELIHQILPASRIIICLRDPVERAFSNYLMSLQKRVTKLPFSKIIRMREDSFKKKPILQEILQAGFYYEQVKRYFKIFGSERIKIIIFEKFIKEPKNTLEDILKFLNVNPKISNFKPEAHSTFAVPRNIFASAIINRKYNNRKTSHLFSLSGRFYLREIILTKKVPKPKFSEDDRIFLKNLDNEDVKNLKRFLHRSFPWQNFSQ